MEIFLLYPHQLFSDIELLKNKKVLLIEEPLFFTQFAFHIQKLVFHRASTKFYETYLQAHHIEVEYCEDETYLKTYQNSSIYIYDVVDDWLLKKLQKHFSNLTIYPNPNFLNVQDQNRFMHHFYINRRKELGILLDRNNKPQGGKWSFDNENRKKLPKEITPPVAFTYTNRFIEEAKDYCTKFKSVGEINHFYYPITFEEARANFQYFLKYKLENFGDYQDAICKNQLFIYHSNISISLNSGLLDLHYILDEIQKADAPLNAKEGFIRQIIGWREFMLCIYRSSHVLLRTTNFFHFHKKIPQKILEAKSGLDPVDDVIKQLHITAYNHHIQRLMILGNIFLLLECDPDDVYSFFMQYYIDSFDWVMVGNVYGMSQFSDGESITTKPYISSSNYILKMSSDYKKSDPWCKIWDGLYWRFLDKYKALFQNIPRMQMQLQLLDKLDRVKLQNHIETAEDYLQTLET